MRPHSNRAHLDIFQTNSNAWHRAQPAKSEIPPIAQLI
jgi:hypothetical protein